MKIAIALFDRFTALDAVGPYEVLSRLPGAEVVFVAAEKRVYRTDIGALALLPGATFAEVDRADILLVPGGPGTRAMMTDEALIGWVRRVHETTQWTTSVCTGSLVLGAAGVLNGLDAVTHWGAMDQLPALGAKPLSERVVIRGKVVTAAGVSAGIDMALTLAARIAGEDVAKAIQLGIEYDPQPPFDSGHPSKAAPETIQIIAEMMRESEEAHAAA
jgi:putative intracellular protease/amidase